MAKTHGAFGHGRGSDRLEADSFRLGYRLQTHWDWSVAAAFFFAEWGAGLFLVAMLVHHVAGMVLGLLLVGIGKSGFQLMHTGVRQRAWRAVLRPDRSWISRGSIGVAAFLGLGTLYVAIIALDGPAALRVPLSLAAGAAALVVGSYQGFAMAHSTAIALWSSASMPLLSLLYSLTSGVTSVLLLQALGSAPSPVALFANVAVGLLVGLLIAFAAILHVGYHGSPGARVSVDLLRTGQTGHIFHGVVLGIGVVLPASALWFGSGSTAWVALATAGVLAGFAAFRVLVLRVGVYEPVLPF